jgi:hypothetical protein
MGHNVTDMSLMQCVFNYGFFFLSILFLLRRYNFFYQVIPNSNIHDLANQPTDTTSTQSIVLQNLRERGCKRENSQSHTNIDLSKQAS